MNEELLPDDSRITTLWIIAIILTLTGFCCGFLTSLPALIISIVALKKANRNIRMFHAEPTVYASRSLSSVNVGRVISIITLIISAVITLFYLLYFLIYGAFIGSLIWAGANAEDWETNDYYDDEWSEEVIEEWEMPDEVENDTLIIDSLTIDTLDY